MQSAAPDSGGDRRLARGAAWFAGGSAVIVAAYMTHRADTGRAGWLAVLAAVLCGAYAVVVGLESMGSRWLALRRARDGPAARRCAIAALVVVTLGAAAGAGAWLVRAPYWRAVRAFSDGSAAAGELRAIAERHAAGVQTGAQGQEALALWRESARLALALRPRFESARAAAGYLSEHASGRLRQSASIEARFFDLCLEWMELFDSVQARISEESMEQPAEDWSRRLDDIVERIQSLPPSPGAAH